MIAFDGALEAFALADADNIHVIADGKHVGAQLVARP
jgi:hypothetical protein